MYALPRDRCQWPHPPESYEKMSLMHTPHLRCVLTLNWKKLEPVGWSDISLSFGHVFSVLHVGLIALAYSITGVFFCLFDRFVSWIWEKVSYFPTHICASQRHILEAEKTVYLIVYIIFYLFLLKKIYIYRQWSCLHLVCFYSCYLAVVVGMKIIVLWESLCSDMCKKTL